jgi:hypothetical protein
MVIEAQMDSGAFFSQNSGGPRNVVEMQAAVLSGISDIRLKLKVTLPICRQVKMPVQAHSNPIIEVEKDDEVLMSTRAL